MATIDIDGIKKMLEKGVKPEGMSDSEFEQLQKKAQIDKEPPFWPEVRANVEKLGMNITGNVLKTGKVNSDDDAFSDAMTSLREAIQYYTNKLMPPAGKVSPYETAIIAIAAKQVHRMLDETITKGVAGNGPKEFLYQLNILSLGMKGTVLSGNSRTGEMQKSQVDAEVEKVAEEAAAAQDSSAEKCSKKLFEAIKGLNDGTSKFGGAQLPAKFFSKMIADDPAAQAVVDALLACEDGSGIGS